MKFRSVLGFVSMYIGCYIYAAFPQKLVPLWSLGSHHFVQFYQSSLSMIEPAAIGKRHIGYIVNVTEKDEWIKETLAYHNAFG